MDKKIKALAKKEMEALKGTKSLLKADKKRDTKIEKCDKVMGKGKSHGKKKH